MRRRLSPPGLSGLFGLCSIAALVAACSGPPASTSYFPLEGGHRWVFDQISEWDGSPKPEHEEIILTTLGEETLESGKAWRRRSETGVDYWLRADESGIFRVASKIDTEEAPNPDKPPRYVLKTPLVVGTTWQAMTTTYLLRRKAEFPPEIRHSHKPTQMIYRIEAVGEKVTTRAGQFDDCLRVQGTASVKLYTDPVNGYRDVPLITQEWYCKGAGLVKVERTERSPDSSFLQGGQLKMELLEWK